jgi:hypothetical protein
MVEHCRLIGDEFLSGPSSLPRNKQVEIWIGSAAQDGKLGLRPRHPAVLDRRE